MYRSGKAFLLAVLRWTLTALVALTFSALSAISWERQLPGPVFPAHFRIVNYESTGKDWQADDERIYRNRAEDNGLIRIEYGYVTLHNDQAYLKLAVDAGQYNGYRKSFGYLKSEMDDLFKIQQKKLAEAYNQALVSHPPPAELQATYVGVQKEYKDGVKNLVRSRGLRYLSESLLAADIPSVVEKNVKNLRQVAESVSDIMINLGYDSDDLLGTTLPLVQTAISYSKLPLEEEGRMIAGFSQPLEVLLEGRGDCDSKTGLLASILLNWDKVRLVGVGVPGHYLLGVLMHPARGDAFVEYEGLTYVLVEPSGPAWAPPGVISDYTQKWLEARDGVIIEQLTGKQL